jgi:predicted nucleic acid-binding protein
MTCYAVIDTNVLVSALLSSHDDAATVLVVGKLFSGEAIHRYSKRISGHFKHN